MTETQADLQSPNFGLHHPGFNQQKDRVMIVAAVGAI
jgi:hypothetical protein